MKVVIDIPEWKYKSICEGVEASKRCGVVGIDPDIHEAIYNGTLLPKGHGDLIDRDALIQKQFIPNVGWELVDLDDLKTAPTIIPADK